MMVPFLSLRWGIKEYTFGFSFINSIQLPDTLLRIGKGAFEESFISIDLLDSVIEIADNAFYSSELQNCNISVNSNLTSIGSRAFYMTKMSDFTMPPKITIVGSEVFLIRYLSKINFHEGISIIHDYFNSVHTDSINIPDSVTSIVSNAFLQNSKLLTNKTSLNKLSEYGLSDNQIARYSWMNKTADEMLR